MGYCRSWGVLPELAHEPDTVSEQPEASPERDRWLQRTRTELERICDRSNRAPEEVTADIIQLVLDKGPQILEDREFSASAEELQAMLDHVAIFPNRALLPSQLKVLEDWGLPVSERARFRACMRQENALADVIRGCRGDFETLRAQLNDALAGLPEALQLARDTLAKRAMMKAALGKETTLETLRALEALGAPADVMRNGVVSFLKLRLAKRIERVRPENLADELVQYVLANVPQDLLERYGDAVHKAVIGAGRRRMEIEAYRIRDKSSSPEAVVSSLKEVLAQLSWDKNLAYDLRTDVLQRHHLGWRDDGGEMEALLRQHGLL